ncbi:uncharacterized protein GIQ15_01889 [Arthroderma uncinatum]|uniref:uncharacterized protein n=1 Tax=Arthroderma uncinatum TaxID=74035 RepID=UPI00144AB99D|nr:uncharacterized protein GIQ15_01889 [Arthroderma uncinatum]KAF3492372.1 hypothetical protein GIQ15_01889 [Arthroderma uncinatum]
MLPTDPAAIAAAQEAGRQATIEIWTLFGVGFTATILRLYARVHAVGFRNLRPDDYLVVVALVLYAVQSTLGYSVGNLAHGLANNIMSDKERALLEVGSPEYEFRVIGSKIQISGWTVYTFLISMLKFSMLAFYIRLTEGVGGSYRLQIYVGFGLVGGTCLASLLTIFTACRPFYKYWQINPNPGNVCQPAVSLPIVWVSFAANIITDIYLILIPLPMLWRSTLRTIKKIAASIVLGAGIFVLVCACLKSIFVLVNPVNGAQLAGAWGVREAFVAVMVTNLPMIFPLIRAMLSPFFGKLFSTQRKSSYKSPGFQTIGGGTPRGGNSSHNRNTSRRQPQSDLTTSFTLNGSNERIVDDNNNVKMQDLKSFASIDPEPNDPPARGIMISNSVEVMHEDRGSTHDEEQQRVEHVREAW